MGEEGAGQRGLKTVVSRTSPIEKLLQHVVHGLAVLGYFRGRIDLRRCRRCVWTGRLGRRERAALAAALAEALLQQVAEGRAELVGPAIASRPDAAPRSGSTGSAQSAQHTSHSAPAANQALAHFSVI